MRLWFEHSQNFLEDVKIGINWYRHHKNHSWFGFTVHFVFLNTLISLNFVDDYAKYNLVVNKPNGWSRAFAECPQCKTPHLKFALKPCSKCNVKICGDCSEKHEVNCP